MSDGDHNGWKVAEHRVHIRIEDGCGIGGEIAVGGWFASAPVLERQKDVFGAQGPDRHLQACGVGVCDQGAW